MWINNVISRTEPYVSCEYVLQNLEFVPLHAVPDAKQVKKIFAPGLVVKDEDTKKAVITTASLEHMNEAKR